MRQNIFYLLLAVFSISLLIVPVSSLSEEDSCKETGIVVKNLTLKKLWYKKDDGSCFLWRRDYMFTIYPEDSIGVYSDLTCETLYCGACVVLGPEHTEESPVGYSSTGVYYQTTRRLRDYQCPKCKTLVRDEEYGGTVQAEIDIKTARW